MRNEQTSAHLVTAAKLDTAVVDAKCLHRREKVLHRPDPRVGAFASPKRRAELRPWLSVPHLCRHPRLLLTLHEEIPTLASLRREQRGGDARSQVEPTPDLLTAAASVCCGRPVWQRRVSLP